MTLTLAQAEDLAARTLAAIDMDDDNLGQSDAHTDDREQVASDLAGLRDHQRVTTDPNAAAVWRKCQACSSPVLPCRDARRYAAGLVRVGKRYGQTPAPRSTSAGSTFTTLTATRSRTP